MTQKQLVACLANLKKIKRPGGAGNAAWKATGSRNLAAGRKKAKGMTRERLAALGLLDSEACRKRRYAQIEHEQNMAKELEADGFVVFSPTVVCDRVAIKDGKVFFVEFKSPDQKPRPGQQAICDLVPESYLIRYG